MLLNLDFLMDDLEGDRLLSNLELLESRIFEEV
jgi:hypothetical protein